MLTQRTQRSLRTESPDAGRGADAERKGISDVGMWEGRKVSTGGVKG